MTFAACTLVLGVRGMAGERIDEVVKVRAVEFALLARDASGAPVADLSAADLDVRLADESLMFRLQPRATEAASANRPDVRLTLQVGSTELAGVRAAADPAHYVFFVDRGADTGKRAAQGAETLIRFVRDDLAPHDRVAVLAYNGTLQREIAFSADRERIAEAIRAAYRRPRAPGPTTRQRVQSLIDRIERCEHVADNPFQPLEDGRQDDMLTTGALPVDPKCVLSVAAGYIQENQTRAERYFRSLEQTLRYAGGLRDRVTLVALTHGVSADPDREFSEVARGIIGTRQLSNFEASLSSAEAARVALSRLRNVARGEDVSLVFVDSARVPSGVRTARQSRLVLDGSTPVQLAHRLPVAPLTELATSTAGAFIQNVDTLQGLRQALDLERGRYELIAYLPAGVGEIALGRVTIRSKQSDVEITQQSELEPTGSVRARIEFGDARAMPGSTSIYLPFAVGAPPGDLDYRLDGSKRVGRLTLNVLVETTAGEHLVSAYQELGHTLETNVWETQRDVPLEIRGWIEAPPGRYLVSAVVRSYRTGRAGRVVRSVQLTAP